MPEGVILTPCHFLCNIAVIIAVGQLCKTAHLVTFLLIIVLGKLKYQTNKTKRQKNPRIPKKDTYMYYGEELYFTHKCTVLAVHFAHSDLLHS